MESNPPKETKIIILPGDRITLTVDRPVYFYYRCEDVPKDDRFLEITL